MWFLKDVPTLRAQLNRIKIISYLLQAKVTTQSGSNTQQPLCLLCYVTIRLKNTEWKTHILKCWFNENTKKTLLLLFYLLWFLSKLIILVLFAQFLRYLCLEISINPVQWIWRKVSQLWKWHSCEIQQHNPSPETMSLLLCIIHRTPCQLFSEKPYDSSRGSRSQWVLRIIQSNWDTVIKTTQCCWRVSFSRVPLWNSGERRLQCNCNIVFDSGWMLHVISITPSQGRSQYFKTWDHSPKVIYIGADFGGGKQREHVPLNIKNMFYSVLFCQN